MKLIGRIQGPVKILSNFQNTSEVVFVFNRQLKPTEIWNIEKQKQLAQSAFGIRAVSDVPVPDNLSPNLVSLKARMDYVRSLG